MKILHTSDWHLGQKFLTKDRQQEHAMALDWLLGFIRHQEIEVLIVAGDIFDIGNPPNYARKLYYQFLTQLIGSQCRHIVIVGGNHDSPSMLEAPKELLESLNMHVVGAVPEELSKELLYLRDSEGQLELLIAAVPFLRDRDLRSSVAGETGAQRIEMIKEGIRNHYEEVASLIGEKEAKKVPIIATGHLYASGAEASGKQDNIYIGNKENIRSDQFPAIFDYVALGHIHRAQAIGKKDHIRYSGSIIPLSFSETKDEKSITLLHWEGKALKKMEIIPIPQFRRLKTIQGNADSIINQVATFAERHQEELPPWIELIVETPELLSDLQEKLDTLREQYQFEILKIRVARVLEDQMISFKQVDLEDLEVLEVFQKKCIQAGLDDKRSEEMETAFRELQTWMIEQRVDEA